MTSQRPGQVRFEAWVPTALMEQFKAAVPNKTAWLREQMTEAVPVTPECRHTNRKKVGERSSLGQTIPEWACASCGTPLT